MISLFEPMEIGRNEIPVDLVMQGVRGVSLLEFSSLEDEVDSQVATEEAKRYAAAAPEFEASARAKQVAAMIDAAREDAARQARREYEEELTQRLERERARVVQVCTQFALDRQQYFAAAEGQVVKLAIAVARRVLMKEIADDGMHLGATVRAALARVQEGTKTVLRVRDEERSIWIETFSSDTGDRIQVVGDDRLAVGECVLETEVGRVELGVEVQLAEIERGFGELMQRRGA